VDLHARYVAAARSGMGLVVIGEMWVAVARLGTPREEPPPD
jgi:hypothetical protein